MKNKIDLAEGEEKESTWIGMISNEYFSSKKGISREIHAVENFHFTHAM